MINRQRTQRSILTTRTDWLYSVEINRRFLQLIGAWPLSFCTSSLEKVKSVILTAISTFLIWFLLLPCALCTFLDNGGDLDTKIKMIGPLSFCVMSAIKHFVLVTRGSQIADCIYQVRHDWSDAVDRGVKRDIMLESAKFGRSLMIVCAVFMYSGGFSYTTVMPLLAHKTEIIDNQTVRSQAFPIYRGLLDPRTSPSFEIVQLMQCLAGFIIYTVTISVCSLAAVFAMHACGQFKILAVMLNDVVDGEKGAERDNDTAEKRLGQAVKHHLRILGFITRVERLLHEVCLVEFLGCTLNICFLGYYLLTEWEHNQTLGTVTYFILMISFIFNIFILCYIGGILSEQSEKVGLIAYMTEWYRLPDKKASGLILIQAVSNSSVKLTAGKFVELSLPNFCSVLKSSFAYLSLLRTLTT